jgi:hypothetical protein
MKPFNPTFHFFKEEDLSHSTQVGDFIECDGVVYNIVDIFDLTLHTIDDQSNKTVSFTFTINKNDLH